MRKFFPLLFLLILVITVLGQSGRKLKNPPPPKPPEPVPEALTNEPRSTVPTGRLSALPKGLLDRELEGVDKGSFRLADFTGKVIVVNLWATWCGPCRREIPDYERVRKNFADREVEFIALTTEDPITMRNRVQKFARDFNFNFRLGWADRETAQTLMNGRNVIPQTLVLAFDGRVISHWSGYSPQSGDRLRAAINSALSEIPSSARNQ